LFSICKPIPGGLYVFLILSIAVRESVKTMMSRIWYSVTSSRALIMAIADSAVKIEQGLRNLYINSMLFQINAAPTQ